MRWDFFILLNLPKQHTYKMSRLFALILFLIGIVGFAQKQLPLIPQPKSLIQKEGSFTLNQGTLILIGNYESDNEISLFNQFLKTGFGFELITTTNSKSPLNTIQILVENPNDAKNGAYELNISTTQIRINAKSNLGLFYAFQTLQQLLPFGKN